MAKTILCDLGNVIVFVDHKKITEGLEKFSNKNKDEIHNFFINSRARKKFDKGRISPKQLFEDFKSNLNLNMNFNQFKRIWRSCFYGLNKDMEKLLYRLKKNYKLVLLSNTDEMHFNYIKSKYKVLNIFNEFVLSYKVGCAKPNPLIYLEALKKCRAFPWDIIYIDDISKFVATAKLFGIKSLQYKNFGKLKQDLKNYKVKL
ncbi:HAD hydrolase-like protein [Candidatus Woesearchaeota archaeon]|nr:HAD hydrolase-like protein [Candidatus Woesearchaeota archaeon]